MKSDNSNTMRYNVQLWHACILIVMLTSCSAAKQKLSTGLDELVGQNIVFHSEEHDINDDESREDSVFVVLENKNFKSFYGYNGYLDFETTDSKQVSYGFGGKHYTDPVKHFSVYSSKLKHLNYIKNFSKFGGIDYKSENLDTIVVNVPFNNKGKKFWNYTVIFRVC
jgi:hypothetical protein